MNIFITGTSGFIGFHLAQRLLRDGHAVLGFDGMTAYYDLSLKRRRRAILAESPQFISVEGRLEDKALLERTVLGFAPEIVVHLAAQAGVRYSLENPEAYVAANLVGMFNLLEAARQAKPRHLLIASSSSVYGGNPRMPFGETDRTDFPLSLYAATKKAGEAMSHSHAHLFDLPTTCFRFFTVYGAWSRPDMAMFKFVDAIEHDRPIEIYGQGRMQRDFTYVGDLVEGIVRLMDVVPGEGRAVMPEGIADSLSPSAPWRSVNIAGGHPSELLRLIEIIETCLGKTAAKTFLPMQPGDVAATFADTRLFEALVGKLPATPLETGIKAFVDWHREYNARA